MIKIRNIAIIAHVDHGKTTLVDALLRQSKTKLSKEQEGQEAILDSNELERERGITIFSKNASVHYGDTKINIIDTPGHADFGGEVERVLKMADGALLLVDAKEGPMPQTRFVLKHALKLGLKIIVVVNKIDKDGANPLRTVDQTFDLFVELGADESSAFFPVIYASGRDGLAGTEPDLAKMTDITPLFDSIMEHIPAPTGDAEKPLQLHVANISADNYKGRIATGRIYNGRIKSGTDIVHISRDGIQKKCRVTSLIQFEGLGRVEVTDAQAGDIVAVAGIQDVTIGETIADVLNPVALPLIDIEEPTIKMWFNINTSPFAGQEGEYKTSRQIRERLYKELENDVSLKVEDDTTSGKWIVSGRGELHLAILIERMRREGYEFEVSRPQVINKVIDGINSTPFEWVSIETPEAYSGSVIQKMGERRAQLQDMKTDNGVTYMEFVIATRDLFGYRTEFMTDTKGMGLINSVFYEYRQDPGISHERQHGSLVAYETGITRHYGLAGVQDRGVLFISPNQNVYKGQVVGQNTRSEDISINVCKEKKLSNMRSKGDGPADILQTPRIMSLENALEYIDDSELVEVTPLNIRIRKTILDEVEARKQAAIKRQHAAQK